MRYAYEYRILIGIIKLRLRKHMEVQYAIFKSLSFHSLHPHQSQLESRLPSQLHLQP
jgi:hypothetical protein